MSIMNVRTRNPTFDFMKFSAMLMVVFYHVFDLYFPNFDQTPFSNFLWLLQIPVFFFVSGMLSSRPEKISSFSLLRKKVFRNAMFYLWPTLTFILLRSVYLERYWDRLGLSFLEFFMEPSAYLWFLWVLFFVVISFDIFVYLSNFTKHLFVQHLLPLIGFLPLLLILGLLIYKGIIPGTYLGVRYFVYYSPFYCLGYVTRLIKPLFDKFRKRSRLCLLLASFATLISCFVFFFEIFYFKSIVNFDDSSIKYLLFRMIGSACGCYFWLFVCEQICKTKIGLFTSKGGFFSLQCYYLHMLAISCKFLPEKDSFLADSAPGVYCFGLTNLLLVLVAAFLVLMYFIPYSYFLVFGKSFSVFSFEKKSKIANL
jgi:hypothetical protein